MTTIVYRDGILAADSQTTVGKFALTNDSLKISKLKNGGYFAGSGTVCEIKMLFDWYNNGKRHGSESKQLNCIALVIEKEKIFILYGDLYKFEVKESYVAIGSGRDFAYGALYMGATAKEAVKAACRFDCYSGGKIKEVKIKVKQND